jgi:hypothetical protein
MVLRVSCVTSLLTASLAVVVQVDLFGKQTLKPGYHV